MTYHIDVVLTLGCSQLYCFYSNFRPESRYCLNNNKNLNHKQDKTKLMVSGKRVLHKDFISNIIS